VGNILATQGMSGKLKTKKIRAIQPSPIHSIKIPGLGRFAFSRDQGEASLLSPWAMNSHLAAHHFDGDGVHVQSYDLGSGLTTQSLAIALSNQGVSANNTGNTLGLLKYMSSGTGTTAAAAQDYQLQTQSGPVTSALTPTLGFSGTNATMQWVGTINYSGTLAITEWGLFAGGGTVGSQYNTSTDTFTSTTATPGTSPSWTTNTWAGGYIVIATTGPVIGFITSNSATALTVNPGWANATSGGGSATTPSSNTAINIYPLMADHKVFSAINVVSGDSIQFTYTLTVQSGT
jgi:hypothetical protein